MYLRRLRDMREDADMSQENVAAHLGIRQTVYSRYERGERAIPVHHLVRLADLYDVSIDFLCGRTNDMKLHK